jgi:transposase
MPEAQTTNCETLSARSVIEPVLPMDRRGPKPRENRRVLNGIFWVLRTGAPWRDLPERYGPYTSAYNRLRKAGILSRRTTARCR